MKSIGIICFVLLLSAVAQGVCSSYLFAYVATWAVPSLGLGDLSLVAFGAVESMSHEEPRQEESSDARQVQSWLPVDALENRQSRTGVSWYCETIQTAHLGAQECFRRHGGQAEM